MVKEAQLKAHLMQAVSDSIDSDDGSNECILKSLCFPGSLNNVVW